MCEEKENENYTSKQTKSVYMPHKIMVNIKMGLTQPPTASMPLRLNLLREVCHNLMNHVEIPSK